MSAPVIVQTKLRLPVPGAALVPRPRLLPLLNAGRDRRLTLVQAPAGFGKTTLIAAWCASEQARRTAVWIALDPDDDDPLRLWSYVAEALHRADPSLGRESLPALRAPGASLLETALPMLLNELAELDRPLIVVLDDYHVIASPEAHRAVTFFIEHLPPRVQLVLASRSEPPLPLGRLRARGELIELDVDALRFTAGETAALLNDLLALELGMEELTALHRRTEGWAACLYLVALRLRSQADRSAGVEAFSGSDRHVVDYLGQELLHAQPAAIQRFLLRTSILSRLSGPLCDAVTGTEDRPSAGILRTLERASLLVPLDHRQEWYRHHHLFAEALRHELAVSEPALLPVLHRRAAAWWRDAGNVDEAIGHATAAGDLDEVKRLVAGHWILYVDRWWITTVRNWLRNLPEGVVRADPVLTLVSAWLGLSFEEPAEMDRWLSVAETLDFEGPLLDGTPSLEVGIASLRAVSGFHGVGTKMAAARRVLQLQRDPGSPWRQGACWALAFALYLSGRISAARASAQEAIPGGRSVVLTTTIRSLALLGLIEADAGRPAEARTITDRAIELVEEGELTESPVVGCVWTLAGRTRMAAGDLAGALAAHERAFALQRYPIERFHALVELLPVRHASGDAAGVRELLAEADRLQALRLDFGELPAKFQATARRIQAPAPVPTGSEQLSIRELDVLQLLSGPLSQPDIGRELYISRDTVKSHVKSIYRKLGVSSRRDAVDIGRGLGLIP
jgi:LuxR family maltose regulon positive regulatory protein